MALVVAGRAISDTVFDRLGFGLGPTEGTPDRAVDHVLLVYGVLGAVILGWAVLMVLLAVGPLARRERWAWWTVVASTSAWLVVDTAMSMARGYVGHAAFNLVFLVALGVPLLGIRGRLHPTSMNFPRR
ncbi:hypothetical protein [Iamia sp.]|uniref:hypothetical protein n=1 Tax=Iamia sp. TaxID=2722710 RepID=UPI002C8016DB|nr:hypothetical protein [Iamia sp.]HXH55670.1 hypothetical protein [Iamia sp.]